MEPVESQPPPPQKVDVDTARPSLDELVAPPVDDVLTAAARDEVQRLDDAFKARVDHALALKHEIPHDPVPLGLAQFNARVARLNHDINEVAQLRAMLISEKRRAQERRDRAKSALREKITLLLENNEDVRSSEGGQRGREAAAEALCAEDQRKVDICHRIYTIVLGYDEATRLVFDTLKETKADNMRQLAVVKEQIKLGEVSSADFPIEGNAGNSSVLPSPQKQKALEVEAEVAQIAPPGGGNITF
jgi:hypothetical protein